MAKPARTPFETVTPFELKRLPTFIAIISLLAFVLVACDKTPPDTRGVVTLPVYTNGDAAAGKMLYEDLCSKCHQLTPGLNKKGPQLLNIYGAKAAMLKDYKYSNALTQSGWTWDATTLDAYIADPKAALADTRMLSDPVPDATERQDIIAYLSTLRQEPPANN